MTPSHKNTPPVISLRSSVEAGPSGGGFISQVKRLFIQFFLSFQSQNFDGLSFCPLNVDNLEVKLLFPELIGFCLAIVALAR